MLGISLDSRTDNLAFKERYQLPFPLLCDEDRKVSLLYGACNFKKAYYTRRITYIIDDHGVIKKVFPAVKAEGHAAEVLGLLP